MRHKKIEGNEGEHGTVTELILKWKNGDEQAKNKLFPQIIGHLYEIANGLIYQKGSGETIDTTALVHEVYIKLSSEDRIQWQNKSQFYSVSSTLMRWFLVDYARKKKSKKRGGDLYITSLSDNDQGVVYVEADRYLDLHNSLKKLGSFDEHLVKIAEHRFFGGLTIEQTADALGISEAKVSRDQKSAIAWLSKLLRD